MGRHRWFEIVFLLSGGLLAASPAAAQSYTNVVWDQLQAAYTTADAQGYSTRNYIVGKLDQDDIDTWTFELFGGTAYNIVGVCDGDCKDIDLEIYDENDNEIASDTAADDIPILNFTPRATGRFSIDVTMYECSVNPCYFGIGIFYQ